MWGWHWLSILHDAISEVEPLRVVHYCLLCRFGTQSALSYTGLCAMARRKFLTPHLQKQAAVLGVEHSVSRSWSSAVLLPRTERGHMAGETGLVVSGTGGSRAWEQLFLKSFGWLGRRSPCPPAGGFGYLHSQTPVQAPFWWGCVVMSSSVLDTFSQLFFSCLAPSFERYAPKLGEQRSELEQTCYLVWSGLLPMQASSLQLPSVIPDFLVLMCIL